MVLVTPAADPVKRRAPFPEGTLPVGFALLIAGIASYAFFRVGTSALGGEDEFARSRRCGSPRSRWRPGSSCRSSRSSAGRSPTVGPSARAADRSSAGGPARRHAGWCRPRRHRRPSPVITRHYFDGDWVMVVRAGRSRSSPTRRPTSRGASASGTGRFRAYAIVHGRRRRRAHRALPRCSPPSA